MRCGDEVTRFKNSLVFKGNNRANTSYTLQSSEDQSIWSSVSGAGRYVFDIEPDSGVFYNALNGSTITTAPQLNSGSTRYTPVHTACYSNGVTIATLNYPTMVTSHIDAYSAFYMYSSAWSSLLNYRVDDYSSSSASAYSLSGLVTFPGVDKIGAVRYVVDDGTYTNTVLYSIIDTGTQVFSELSHISGYLNTGTCLYSGSSSYHHVVMSANKTYWYFPWYNGSTYYIRRIAWADGTYIDLSTSASGVYLLSSDGMYGYGIAYDTLHTWAGASITLSSPYKAAGSLRLLPSGNYWGYLYNNNYSTYDLVYMTSAGAVTQLADDIGSGRWINHMFTTDAYCSDEAVIKGLVRSAEYANGGVDEITLHNAEIY